jgi:hypothetical protein
MHEDGGICWSDPGAVREDGTYFVVFAPPSAAAGWFPVEFFVGSGWKTTQSFEVTSQTFSSGRKTVNLAVPVLPGLGESGSTYLGQDPSAARAACAVYLDVRSENVASWPETVRRYEEAASLAIGAAAPLRDALWHATETMTQFFLTGEFTLHHEARLSATREMCRVAGL